MRKSHFRDAVADEQLLSELLEKLETHEANPEELFQDLGTFRRLLSSLGRRNRDLMRLIRAMGRLGVFIKNYENGLALPNGLWKSLGYGPEDMSGDAWTSALHPDDVEEVRKSLDGIFYGGQDISQAVYRIRGKESADYKWILSKSIVVTRSAEGKPAWFVGMDFDITLRVRSEENARRARTEAEKKALEAETLLAASAIIASTLDWENSVQRVLDQASLVVPNEITLVVLMVDDTIRIVGGRRADGVPVETGGPVPVGGKNPYIWISDERRPLSVSDMATAYPQHAVVAGVGVHSWLGVPLIAADRLLGALVFARSEIGHYDSEHIRLAAAFAEHVSLVLHNAREFREVRLQATTDALTEALTRRAFMAESRNELNRCKAQGAPFAAIMIDLDHFKDVNDNCGHPAGDEVLRTTARYWKAELRDGDLFGRLGGEEFAVVLPGAPARVAVRIAERLRKRSMEVVVACDGRQVTASFGVAADDGSFESDPSIEDMIRRADQLLYRAKSEGRNRVVSDRDPEPEGDA
jgi:diguanylate cyclase (GGDEF)-like protein